MLPKRSIYCPFKDSASKYRMGYRLPESLNGQYTDPLGCQDLKDQINLQYLGHIMPYVISYQDPNVVYGSIWAIDPFESHFLLKGGPRLLRHQDAKLGCEGKRVERRNSSSSAILYGSMYGSTRNKGLPEWAKGMFTRMYCKSIRHRRTTRILF